MEDQVPSKDDVVGAIDETLLTIWAQDRALRYVWVVNPGMGFRDEDVIKDMVGKTDMDLLDPSTAVRLEDLKRRAMEERAIVHDTATLTRDGIEETHQFSIKPVYSDDDEVLGITGVSTRLSDATQMLAVEADHRIKNSLMLAQALLRSQQRSVTDKAANAALDRAAGQIGSIAHMHGELAEAGTGGLVNIRHYLDTVCHDLMEIMGDDGATALHVEVEDMVVDGRAALNVALIVSELITNSLKHAAVDGQDLAVHVRLHNSENRYHLVVEDDGKGLPVDFDLSGSTSVGMRLVRSMAKAFGAEPQIDTRANGARFVFDFPQKTTAA